MDNQGWIKLYRKIGEHEIMRDAYGLQIFIWLLIHVDRATGQYTSGRFVMSEALKIKPRTLHKVVTERLQNRYHLVTLLSDNKKTTFSICKWKSFQESSDTKSDTKVTPEGQQSDTKQELRIKNVTNNAPANADIDLDKLLVEGNDKGITHEFQLLGLDIFELTGAPPEKKAECFRIAKQYPEGTVMTALSFAKDYPQPKLKWKMFLWKLNALCKKS